MMRLPGFFLVLLCCCQPLSAERLMVLMDLTQKDHLKAYGLAFWSLERGVRVEWLLNYRGGSFLLDYREPIAAEAHIRGVSFVPVSASQAAAIYAEIDASNMEVVLLEKAPRIAIYTPPNSQPWDDAVTMALEYAQIKYHKVWDPEVLKGALDEYDWLHLHHEDFTGQYGKFYQGEGHKPWYREQQRLYEAQARHLGFGKVSEEKKAVARAIFDYVSKGGFLFAMCSATDTIDIALAAAGVDIVHQIYDGDPADPLAQNKIDFSRTFAFENFTLVEDPLFYEYSDIDTTPTPLLRARGAEAEYFTLFEFSAKHDPVPTMLTQCHTNIVNGFIGQTTDFKRQLIKESVVILGEVENSDAVKYIHGQSGRGTFTFYGGHDPEDYKHHLGDPPTQLELHPNSPGYRLILNNVLFPAAKKKKRRT